MVGETTQYEDQEIAKEINDSIQKRRRLALRKVMRRIPTETLGTSLSYRIKCIVEDAFDAGVNSA